jgi:hypothetical protein
MPPTSIEAHGLATVNGKHYRTMPSRFGIPLVRRLKPSSSAHPQSQIPPIDRLHPNVPSTAVVTHRPNARSNLDEPSTHMILSTSLHVFMNFMGGTHHHLTMLMTLQCRKTIQIRLRSSKPNPS